MPNNAAWNVSSTRLLTQAIRLATSRIPIVPGDGGTPFSAVPLGNIQHGAEIALMAEAVSFGTRHQDAYELWDYGDEQYFNGVADDYYEDKEDGWALRRPNLDPDAPWEKPSYHLTEPVLVNRASADQRHSRVSFNYKMSEKGNIGYHKTAGGEQGKIGDKVYIAYWVKTSRPFFGGNYYDGFDSVEGSFIVSSDPTLADGELCRFTGTDGSVNDAHVYFIDEESGVVNWSCRRVMIGATRHGGVLRGTVSGAQMIIRPMPADAPYESASSHKIMRLWDRSDADSNPYGNRYLSLTHIGVTNKYVKDNTQIDWYDWDQQWWFFETYLEITNRAEKRWRFWTKLNGKLVLDGAENADPEKDMTMGYCPQIALLGLDPNRQFPIHMWISEVVQTNSPARVMLGNAPRLADCTHFELQRLTRWTNGEVRYVVNQGSFESLNNVYQYVFDDNDVCLNPNAGVRLPTSAPLTISVPAKSVGQIITIQTDGTYNFGQGPQVAVYDGFRQGTPGEQLDIDSPQVGGWYEINRYYPARYHEGGRDGGACYEGWDQANNRVRSTTLTFPDSTEVFISFARKHPAGYYYPSDKVTGPNSFPEPGDSCLKESWLMYGMSGNDKDNDLCFMTHWSGRSTYGVSGNDYNYWSTPSGKTAEWFRWDRWIRSSLWLKAGEVPDVDNGIGYLQITNGEAQYVYHQTDRPVFDADRQNTPIVAWNVWKLSAWARGGAPGEIKFLFDDAYFAYGPNAAARVELGNAPVYEECTDLAICPTTSWSESQITAILERGGIDLDQPCWLFITLADNTTRYSIPLV